jgi:hypothetical protein
VGMHPHELIRVPLASVYEMSALHSPPRHVVVAIKQSPSARKDLHVKRPFGTGPGRGSRLEDIDEQRHGEQIGATAGT